jgi:isopentenyl diphosphate isomerase/L-lactate dehydrogenase-like FMN-dependent dehydrogenase
MDVMKVKVTRSERASDASPTQQRYQKKQEVCMEVVTVLRNRGNPVVDEPGFVDELLAHFNQLPTRYALDVNAERAEDVLTHKTLLQNAKDPENRPTFHVRAVHVCPLFPFLLQIFFLAYFDVVWNLHSGQCLQG